MSSEHTIESSLAVRSHNHEIAPGIAGRISPAARVLTTYSTLRKSPWAGLRLCPEGRLVFNISRHPSENSKPARGLDFARVVTRY